MVQVVTEGDLRPAGMSAGEGVFVAALERQLAAGQVDLAIHSAKDVPEPAPGPRHRRLSGARRRAGRPGHADG